MVSVFVHFRKDEITLCDNQTLLTIPRELDDGIIKVGLWELSRFDENQFKLTYGSTHIGYPSKHTQIMIITLDDLWETPLKVCIDVTIYIGLFVSSFCLGYYIL